MIMGILPVIVAIIHGLFYFLYLFLVMSVQEVKKMSVHHALVLALIID